MPLPLTPTKHRLLCLQEYLSLAHSSTSVHWLNIQPFTTFAMKVLNNVLSRLYFSNFNGFDTVTFIALTFFLQNSSVAIDSATAPLVSIDAAYRKHSHDGCHTDFHSTCIQQPPYNLIWSTSGSLNHKTGVLCNLQIIFFIFPLKESANHGTLCVADTLWPLLFMHNDSHNLSWYALQEEIRFSAGLFMHLSCCSMQMIHTSSGTLEQIQHYTSMEQSTGRDSEKHEGGNVHVLPEI